MKKSKNYLTLLTLSALVCFSLTACGNSTTTGSTSGNNDNNVVEDTAENAGDAIEDVAEGAGNAVEDVAQGVGDAVDDLVGGGFENYNDAHDYFMDTMHSYHADANFEIRDEDRELNDYQEGSKGYHFHLYDTSKNTNGELFGEFFVDANSGQIFRRDENGSLSEYPASLENANTNKRKGNTTSSTNSALPGRAAGAANSSMQSSVTGRN